jgi:hypothetical protein
MAEQDKAAQQRQREQAKREQDQREQDQQGEGTAGAVDRERERNEQREYAKPEIRDNAADNATDNPKDMVEGQSFYNPALTGSGTIHDGEYFPPEPDPTQLRGLGPDRTSGGRRLLGGLDPDAPRSTQPAEESGSSSQRGGRNR